MILALVALMGIPVIGAAQEDAQAVVAFADGVRAFNEGRDPDAAERFGSVVEREPRNSTARYWLGLTWLRLGEPRKALEQIDQSLHGGTLQVDPLWVRHDLGAAQLAMGDAEAAATTLSAVVIDVEARLEREEKSPPSLARSAGKRAGTTAEHREELEWEEEARLQARRAARCRFERTGVGEADR